MHKSKSLGRTTVKLTKVTYLLVKYTDPNCANKSTIKVLISGGIIFIFVVLAILFATGIPFTPIGKPSYTTRGICNVPN